MIVGIAAAMGIPFGILVAIYLVEFAPRRVRNVVSLVLDVLMGIPAIVLGIFYYELLVLTTHQQRRLWGSIALATMMLPLVARSTMEILLSCRTRFARRRLGSGFRAGGRRSGSSCRRRWAASSPAASSPFSRIAGEAAPLLFSPRSVATASTGTRSTRYRTFRIAIF